MKWPFLITDQIFPFPLRLNNNIKHSKKDEQLRFDSINFSINAALRNSSGSKLYIILNFNKIIISNELNEMSLISIFTNK